MQYEETADQADAISSRAIAMMRAHAIALTPPNYELMFAYARESLPELNVAVDAALKSGVIADSTLLRELHSRIFDKNPLASFDEMSSKLYLEIQKFTRVLTLAGKDTAKYGQALNEAAAQLHQGDVEQISVILDNLVDATRAIEARHKSVEYEMVASSSEVSRLRDRVEQFRAESRIDSLTTLHNRRGFEERCEELFQEHTSEPFCIAMGDIDHFKQFNDNWGHATGDQVLKLVAQCFRDCVRGDDTTARYGGEEFIVILRGTKLQNAIAVAEKIRRSVESKKIVKRATGESLGSITLSMGVAEYIEGEAISDTIERADQHLYLAKRTGRNRVAFRTAPNATASNTSGPA